MSYLSFTCPLCDRQRLLRLGDDGIECEKCEMKWEDTQAVVNWATEKAARKVQEACAEIAMEEAEGAAIRYARGSFYGRGQPSCHRVTGRIRALDIKKLLEGE